MSDQTGEGVAYPELREDIKHLAGLEGADLGGALDGIAAKHADKHPQFGFTREFIEEQLQRYKERHQGKLNGEAAASANGFGPRREVAPPAVWGDLDASILSTHRAPAPPLPLAIFKGWGPWLEVAGKAKSCPADYVASALLTITGSLMARSRAAAPHPDWTEVPVVWIGNVGLPSSGKSPGLNVIRDATKTREDELNGDYQARRRAWKGEKLTAEIARENWEQKARKGGAAGPMPIEAEEPDPPSLRRLQTNDVTIEKVVRLCAESPFGLALIRDELAGFIGNLNKYGGDGDRAFWLEAWGGGSFTIDRVKHDRPISAPVLACALVGGIQPDKLSEIFAGPDDGLTARILYVWPSDVPIEDAPQRINMHRLTGLLERLGRLALDTPDRVFLPFAPTAVRVLTEWRREVKGLERDASGLLVSWLGKLPGYAVRLAMILEHLWWADRSDRAPEVIGAEAVIAASGLLRDYFLAHGAADLRRRGAPRGRG